MHTADSYRSEWAALTGRSESEIYVPVALREPDLERENDLRRALGVPEIEEPTLDELREALRGES